ncbi:hypothetical protein B0I27_10937 [Arcticibacter pallidicorallinus]|uniref:Uncharacterized protein n=1 Tax=Arcticibacter pallidicorallinus TaxID=1259464 RepID=A0A2T0TX83_9SPHI|nr:hypothetical protein B0I27_10937 [Arcticibacter pallidicorallinus]
MNTYGNLKASASRSQGVHVVCEYAVSQNSKDFITIAPAILGLGASQ